MCGCTPGERESIYVWLGWQCCGRNHSILLAKTAVLRSRGCVIWAICGQSQIWRYTKTNPDAARSMLSVISTGCAFSERSVWTAGFPLATRTRDGGRRGPCMCSGLEIHVPGRGTYSVRTCRSLENQPGHNPQLGKPHRCRMRRCHFRKLLGASTKIYSLVDTPRHSYTVTCHLTSLSLSLFFSCSSMHACTPLH
jgi:hypothetical protein